jgi:hypothetical protein
MVHGGTLQTAQQNINSICGLGLADCKFSFFGKGAKEVCQKDRARPSRVCWGRCT